jgi:glucosylceramidase
MKNYHWSFKKLYFIKLVLGWSALSAIFVIAGSCSHSDNDPNPGPPVQPKSIGKANVWVTSGDKSNLLTAQSDVSLTTIGATTTSTISLDSTTSYQEIEGFGAALTGSSAYLLNRKMTSSQRSALIKDLFDPSNGIGISYLRMTIGASDFSLSDYTYDDMPSGQSDNELVNFSIEKDKDDVVPVLKSIVSTVPGIGIVGSPWSPPAWMKTNGNLRGGKLKADAYAAYAQYFVKYIQAYAQEGITITAVTPQNEPLYYTASYPCMEMQPDEQLNFIKNNLGPALHAVGKDNMIIVYDHNWDNTNYATTIMSDATAKQYIKGAAFHGYAGNVSAMGVVHAAFPDKGLYFTEVSGGAWAEDFSENLMWNTANIFMGTTKNWSKVALLWNLALDENAGPQNNGCNNCRGVVTINSGTGAVTRNVEYYSLAHFSKFVRPRARRIASTVNGSVPGIDHIAFMNTDGSKVLIVQNTSADAQTFSVSLGKRQFSYSLRGKSIASIVWK